MSVALAGVFIETVGEETGRLNDLIEAACIGTFDVLCLRAALFSASKGAPYLSCFDSMEDVPKEKKDEIEQIQKRLINLGLIFEKKGVLELDWDGECALQYIDEIREKMSPSVITGLAVSDFHSYLGYYNDGKKVGSLTTKYLEEAGFLDKNAALTTQGEEALSFLDMTARRANTFGGPNIK